MANKRISELPVATTLGGTELVEVVQGGVNKQADTSLFGFGVSTFEALTDGPGNFVGNALAYNRVNAGATALEYRTPADVKSDIGLANVENTALSTWAGSTNLTTLGTIVTGTWNATVIGSNYGGAGTINGILKANGSGVVSLAVAGTDYLAPSGSGASLSGVWLLASGGTLTGANNIIGTTTNTYTHTFNSLAVTVVDGAGMWMRNTTSAANGAQQISPVLTWEGNGWATTGSVPRSVIWRAHVLPVQGAAPTGQLIFSSEINAVAQSGRLTLNSDGARLVSQTNGLQIIANGGGVGGISFNGSAATSGQITMTPGSFAISTASTWNAAGNGINMSVGSSVNATSGTQNFVNFGGSFVPTSGTAAANFWNFADVVNQTGGANGQVMGLNLAPVFTACAAFTAYNYDPTTPANITGAHYGVRIVPTTAYSSFGLGTPTALVHIGAVTTARASLCINPGSTTTAPSSPVSGDVWHEGTGNRLMFRQGGTSAEVVVTSAVNSVTATLPNRTLTVLINNTTYYIHAKTTND